MKERLKKHKWQMPLPAAAVPAAFWEGGSVPGVRGGRPEALFADYGKDVGDSAG